MKLSQLLSLYNRIRREPGIMRKSLAKQPQQRASAFVLESLENRVLLSATPMDAPTAEPVVTAAVVTTDKADYAPGETAVITASNTSADGLKFGDGELVQFQVTRTDGIQDYAMGNIPWFVTDGVGGFEAYQQYDSNGQAVDRNADGLADLIRPDNDLTVNGSISTNWFVEDQYLGASLQLTATGQTSGTVATTQFTDSGSFGLTTTAGFSDTVSLAAGATNSTALSVDVNAPKNNGDLDVSLTFATTGSTSIGIGSGANQINLTSVTRHFVTGSTGDTQTFPVTVSVGTSVAPGTYHFRATAIDTPDKVNDGKWDFDVIVSAPASTATSTTVTSNLNASTYGDSVTFTATVARTTGTGTPAGSVNFTIQGIGTVAGTAEATTATTATWTYTASALTAGSHTVSASFTGSGGFSNSSGALTGGQTVNQKSVTAAIIGDTYKHYDGNTNATLAAANFQLTGLVGTESFTVTQTSGTYNSKDVATATTVST